MDLIILLLVIIIPLFAQFKISNNYRKYKNVFNKKRLSGFEVARLLLDHNNLKDVYVVQTNSILSNHYDLNRKVVRLSKDIFNDENIVSLVVAAHEVGHAIQDKENNNFLRLRGNIFKIFNITTISSYLLIVLGFIFHHIELIHLGIAFIVFDLIFELITLPIEFNASSIVLKEMEDLKLIDEINREKIMALFFSCNLIYIASILNIVKVIIHRIKN